MNNASTFRKEQYTINLDNEEAKRIREYEKLFNESKKKEGKELTEIIKKMKRYEMKITINMMQKFRNVPF